MRDVKKPKSYFDAYIKSSKRAITLYEEGIARPETEADHRSQLQHSVYSQRLHMLIACYSRGDEVATVAEQFPAVVDSLELSLQGDFADPFVFREFDAYVHGLWLTSLAHLLKAPDELHDRIRDVFRDESDPIFDRLAQRTPSSNVLCHPRPYGDLLNALESGGPDADKGYKKFLKKWYSGMKRTYWHGSHRGENAGYFGYWCLELAALVYLYEIDDSSFADHENYPSDLVDWARR